MSYLRGEEIRIIYIGFGGKWERDQSERGLEFKNKI